MGVGGSKEGRNDVRKVENFKTDENNNERGKEEKNRAKKLKQNGTRRGKQEKNKHPDKE